MTFSRYFYENYISLKEGRYNDDGKFILWAKELLIILLLTILG
jgi:hypothetical protein